MAWNIIYRSLAPKFMFTTWTLSLNSRFLYPTSICDISIWMKMMRDISQLACPTLSFWCLIVLSKILSLFDSYTGKGSCHSPSFSGPVAGVILHCPLLSRLNIRTILEAGQCCLQRHCVPSLGPGPVMAPWPPSPSPHFCPLAGLSRLQAEWLLQPNDNQIQRLSAQTFKVLRNLQFLRRNMVQYDLPSSVLWLFSLPLISRVSSHVFLNLVLFSYNWHATLYKFKVQSIMAGHSIVQDNDDHNSSRQHPSPHIVTQRCFSLVLRTFRIYSLSGIQLYPHSSVNHGPHVVLYFSRTYLPCSVTESCSLFATPVAACRAYQSFTVFLPYNYLASRCLLNIFIQNSHLTYGYHKSDLLDSTYE